MRQRERERERRNEEKKSWKSNPKWKKKVSSTHRKLEQISNIYFVFVVVHYSVHIFPSGFDKGTRSQKKKPNQNMCPVFTKSQAEKKRATNKSTYNHAL